MHNPCPRYHQSQQCDRHWDNTTLTQTSYRKIAIRFKRVGDIEVVKRSVKCYFTILSGQCAVIGGIFATALS